MDGNSVDVSKLRALLKRSSALPWFVGSKGNEINGEKNSLIGHMHTNYVHAYDNAQLAVAAVNALPELISSRPDVALFWCEERLGYFTEDGEEWSQS